MHMRFAFLIAAAIAAFPVTAAEPIRESDIGRLKAGEFEWQPERAPSGPMKLIINLRIQAAYVYRNDILIGVSTISSGKPKHETPTGTFSILEKKKVHRSRKYGNAPMPYMQRLTWYGIALHGGHLPGRPASHGCVRLPVRFAEALFRETDIGMTVTITNEAPGNTTVTGRIDARKGLLSCQANG